MFDIGLPEFAVIAVVALLVFGPDRLPQAAAGAGRFLRQLREAAGSARSEMAAAAGLDDPGVAQAIADFRTLDPRRMLDLGDAPQAAGSATTRAPGERSAQDAIRGPEGSPADPARRADPDWS